MTDKQVINFNINDQRIAKAKEEFKGIDAYKDLDAAKKAKSVLTKMRTTLNEAHKIQKADALEVCQKLDAEKRRLLGLIAEIEDPIKKQLDEIKNAEAKAEQDRLDKIEAAMQSLVAYSADRFDLSIDQLKERIDSLEREEINESRFAESVDTAVAYKDESLMKLRICLKKAEFDAEERAKQAKIAEENARKEAELQAEREAFEKEKRAERAKQQAAEDARLAKELEKLAAERKAIEEENARIAKEKAAKEAQEAAEAAEKRALELAPDTEKLERLAADILATPLPTCDSDDAIAIVSMAQHNLTSLADTILERAGELK